MSNVLDLGRFRRDKDDDYDPVLWDIDGLLQANIISGLSLGLTSREVMNNIINSVAELDDPNQSQKIVDALHAKYSHLLIHYSESLFQMMDYLHRLKYHVSTGKRYVISSSGNESQGEDPFPIPIIIAGIQSRSLDSSESSPMVSISCRRIPVDGVINDYHTTSVCHSPSSIPSEGCTHLAELPTIRSNAEYFAGQCGLVHPFVLRRLLDEFFAVGIACNSGIKFQSLDGYYRLSYLQILPNDLAVAEWAVNIDSSIYTLGDHSHN